MEHTIHVTIFRFLFILRQYIESIKQKKYVMPTQITKMRSAWKKLAKAVLRTLEK